MNTLEQDLYNNYIIAKVTASEVYAQNLYAALCNNTFVRIDDTNTTYGCSWRYAGGIVAKLLGTGDYMDWYCSGIICFDYINSISTIGYVPEGIITDEIKADLHYIGWTILPENAQHDFLII